MTLILLLSCDPAQRAQPSRAHPSSSSTPGLEAVEPRGSENRKTIGVTADCFEGKARPRRMTLACGDNGFRARNLVWTKWGRGGAVGRGEFRMNDCIPGCAAGTFHRRSGTIHLTERRYCLSLDRPIFMSGRVVFDEPFQGRLATDIYPGCPSRS